MPGDPKLVRKAAEILKGARFPVIVAGGGVKWSRAHREVCSLAEALSAPMVTSYGRVDSVPNDHGMYHWRAGTGGRFRGDGGGATG